MEAPTVIESSQFDGTKYSIKFKLWHGIQTTIRWIYAPSGIKESEREQTEILVNVFAGSERSRTELRIGNDGAWLPLENTKARDPNCQRMFDQGHTSTRKCLARNSTPSSVGKWMSRP